MNIFLNDCEESFFEKSCCFTGYRPAKFPFSLEKGVGGLEKVENSLIEAVFDLYNKGCKTFYSGMAMGFDILAAEAVLLLKENHSDVRLICAVPFEGQGVGFPEPWRGRYEKIAERADETVMLANKYYRGCYFKRNAFLVDNTDYVLTWYDGQSGGTAATVKYAQKKGRDIINLNKEYFIPAAKLQCAV